MGKFAPLPTKIVLRIAKLYLFDIPESKAEYIDVLLETIVVALVARCRLKILRFTSLENFGLPSKSPEPDCYKNVIQYISIYDALVIQ